MGYAQASIAGVRCRVFRITFSGELAFEVHVPAGHALTVWEALLRAGQALGIVPYGTEAMAVLRIEKGHVGGASSTGAPPPATSASSRSCARTDASSAGGPRNGPRSPATGASSWSGCGWSIRARASPAGASW